MDGNWSPRQPPNRRFKPGGRKEGTQKTHSVQQTLLASRKSVLPQPGVRGASVYHPALEALSASPSHMWGMSPNPPMSTRPFSNGFFRGSTAPAAPGGGSGGTDRAMDLSRERSWGSLFAEAWSCTWIQQKGEGVRCEKQSKCVTFLK